MDSVIGLITANYEMKDLGTLSEERTATAVPFGGRYRLIDFALSNMVNSGIHSVGLITPYKYRSIIDHVGAGKEWGLARKNGGLFVLPGSVFGIASPDYRFLLRDIKRNSVYLNSSNATYVLVSSANTVYNTNYGEFIRKHILSGADITLLYSEAEQDYTSTKGLSLENGRVIGIGGKTKKGGNRFLDCFIISRELLLKIIEWYGSIDYLDLFEALSTDFDKMDIRAFEYEGYSCSICSVQDYFTHSMDLLNPNIYDELFSENRPIITKIRDMAPTKYLKGSVTKNVLIPAGCIIEGTVENSVLSVNVKIGKNAVVRNSIIMEDCIVEDGAAVENTIIDRNNIIRAGTVIKGSETNVFVKGKNTD